jgi:protein O-mannosyl-transferase
LGSYYFSLVLMNLAIKNIIISVVLLTTLAIGLYFPTLGFDFAYDDILQIQHNPLVTESAGAQEAVKGIFSRATPPGDLYRPLTTLSYRLNFLHTGLHARYFHLTNLILYTLCCVLLFIGCLLLSDSTYKRYGAYPVAHTTGLSFIIALLFTVHPIHVEAVANIVGRAELLACMFELSALICFIQAFRARLALSFSLLLLSGGFFYLLALFAKESALTFVAIYPLAIWAIQPQQQITRILNKRVVSLAIVLLTTSSLMLIMRYRALNGTLLINYPTDLINPENALAYFNPLERAFHGVRILGDYLFLVLAPLKLSADYSRMPEQVFADTYSLIGLVSLLAIMVFGLCVLRQRNKALVFWGSWFFLSFALTANIVTKIGTIMAERLLFTPSIGAIAFVSLYMYQHVHMNKLLRIATVIAASAYAILFCFLTSERLPVWQNNQTLFSQTLVDAPKSPKALYNYAVYLRTDRNDVDQSERYFLETLKILPTHTFSMIALADIALEKKNYARVEYWYKRVLALDPQNYAVKGNLTKLLEFKQSL